MRRKGHKALRIVNGNYEFFDPNPDQPKDAVEQAFDQWPGWKSWTKTEESPMLQCFRAGWEAALSHVAKNPSASTRSVRSKV